MIPLPPNVTAFNQPLDMSVIFVFKRHLRKLMLRELVKDIETLQEPRKTNKGQDVGMNGLEEGCVPHMLDVNRLVKGYGRRCPKLPSLAAGSSRLACHSIRVQL